jgi:hypothetical protein
MGVVSHECITSNLHHKAINLDPGVEQAATKLNNSSRQQTKQTNKQTSNTTHNTHRAHPASLNCSAAIGDADVDDASP